MRGYERSGSGLWVPKRLRGCELMGLQQGILLSQQPTAAPTGSGTTWSPTDKTSAWAVSNGNLRAVGTGNAQAESIRCTRGSATGEKLYCEFPIIYIGDSGYDDNLYFGLTTASQAINAISSPYWLINGAGTVFVAGGSGSGGSGAMVTTDYGMLAFEHDTGRVYFGVNNVWRNSGNPAAGTGYVYDFTTTASFKVLLQTDGNNSGRSHTVDFNDGAAYQGTIPSGFTPW